MKTDFQAPSGLRVVICRSNPVAPDPRVEKIARTLNQAGYLVSVIAWDRSGKLPQKDKFDGISVTRLWIRAQYGNGLANLPALLRWQFGLMRWLWRNRKSIDVLHACDFDTILPVLLCKMLWGKKVIYDIFDFYADHLRRTPAFLKNTIRRLDYWAIQKADGVILVDDARLEQIAGSKPKRLISVYNSPEDVQGKIKNGNHPVSKGDFRVAYVGLLQVERGIFEVLNVFHKHPGWNLDMAGFGGDEEKIVSMIEALPNVSWHGRVSYERALELSEAADVLFATYDPAIPNHRYSSPNKIFEAMMLGKPVIVAQNTNMDRMIQQADCGMIVPYGEEQALEKAFTKLASDPILRKRLGENARRAYENIYCWENMQKRLTDFYKTILREG